MKKLNRREKLYVRLMVSAVILGALMQGWDSYYASKDQLAIDVETLESRIESLKVRLTGESAETYRQETANLEEYLISAQDRVLELPRETDANLYLNQAISEKAEAAGLVINSISNRKSKLISKDKDLHELRTYFGYDAELSGLLQFFDMMDRQPYYVCVENLNISVRRRPKRKVRRKNRVVRHSLNGNAILTTVFRANPDASLDDLAMEEPEPEPDTKKDEPKAVLEQSSEKKEEPIPTKGPTASGGLTAKGASKSKLNPQIKSKQIKKAEKVPPKADPTEKKHPTGSKLKRSKLKRAQNADDQERKGLRPQGGTDSSRPKNQPPKPSYGGPRNWDRQAPQNKPPLDEPPRPLSHTSRPANSINQ